MFPVLRGVFERYVPSWRMHLVIRFSFRQIVVLDPYGSIST